MDNKPYFFTECYACGSILKNCLVSFFKYHPDIQVHVFGRTKDFEELGYFANVDCIILDDDKELEECFKHGHMGTAHMWSRVISEFSFGYTNIVHFDSDTIFRGEIISDIESIINSGYDLVGTRRCYMNNLNGRKDLNELSDVVQTYLFGFNKSKIDNHDFATLRNMIVGFHNPLGHPILDFFDPVSFEIITRNKGKVFFLNPDDVGAQLEDGSKNNKYPEQNNFMDVGDKILHFAGCGSGLAVYETGLRQVNPGYARWALNRYAVYHYLFNKEELLGVKYTDDMKKEIELIKPLIDEAGTCR